MPPKRCQGKGKSMAIKKKKQLEKRLIQISLKLDGFVYKNKPISVFEAERYIQEISSYQKDCAGDPRSLQVIEKLIRCMTSIIAEHKGTFANNSYTNIYLTDHNYCQSPVYSLPDEERSQIIENIREASRNLRDIETIDLCEDDDNAVINNGVSNLSIGDNFIVQNTQSDCSQSILANVEFNTFDNDKVYSNKTNGATNEFRMKIPISNLRSETTNEKNNTQNLRKAIKSNESLNLSEKVLIEGTAKEKSVKPRRNSNKKNCCTVDSFLKPADNQNKRKRNANCEENQANVTQNIEAGVKKGRVKRTNRKTSIKDTISQNPVLKIYNSSTVNDLSWIENIRYVREVSNEEFYTNLKVGEDFWENIDVPGILDDDFSFN